MRLLKRNKVRVCLFDLGVFIIVSCQRKQYMSHKMYIAYLFYMQRVVIDISVFSRPPERCCHLDLLPLLRMAKHDMKENNISILQKLCVTLKLKAQLIGCTLAFPSRGHVSKPDGEEKCSSFIIK